MRRIKVPGGRRAVPFVIAAGLLIGLGACHAHHPGAYGYGGGPKYGHGYDRGYGWDGHRGHGRGHGGGHRSHRGWR